MSWIARLGKHHERRSKNKKKRARVNSAAFLRLEHYLSFFGSLRRNARICRFSITMKKRSSAVHDSGGEHNLCGYMTFAPQIFTVEFRFINPDELKRVFHAHFPPKPLSRRQRSSDGNSSIHYLLFCFNRLLLVHRDMSRDHCIHNAIIDFAVSSEHARLDVYTFKVEFYLSLYFFSVQREN